MREAALFAINNPPGEKVADPIASKFFKKEACDSPTPMGITNWQMGHAAAILKTRRGARC